MNLIISPSGYVNIRHPAQGLSDIRDAGFEQIMLDTSQALDPEILQLKPMQAFCDETHRQQIEMPIAEAGELKSSFFYSDSYELNLKWLQTEKVSVELAVRNGCKSIIVSPHHMCIPYGHEFEENKRFLASLVRSAETCRADDFFILLRNDTKYFEGRYERGFLSDPYEAMRWVEQLNELSDKVHFGICMDIGNLNLCGIDTDEYCRALGDHIKAVILRDNDGNSDDSMLPFSCVKNGNAGTDWLSVIRGLRYLHFDGNLIIDAHDSARFFPATLRTELLRTAYRIGRYFDWQIHMEDIMKKYDHIVLFGAGNMCRNYMKNYGDKYPPLFTCDNDSARWGEQFCGLEIQPPERLKDLPDNTGILICNVYYREIAAQLNGMGITDGIEYFNDEYLDTFYMDRLKEF